MKVGLCEAPTAAFELQPKVTSQPYYLQEKVVDKVVGQDKLCLSESSGKKIPALGGWGMGMTEVLSASQELQQLCRSRGNMVGLTIRQATSRVFLYVISSGLLICGDSSAQASAFEAGGHVDKQVEVTSINPLGAHANVAQLTPQLGSDWISKGVELSASGQHQSITKREPSANKGAQQKHEYRPKNGAGANDMAKGFKHYDPFLILAVNFFGGLLGSLAIVFIMRVYTCGINSAWRDLVFDWPIPYWMRFVPKEEQEL
ncbi:MAG: hypothetical protein AB1807_15690 [Pseudomonadota bacterium]